MLKGTGFRVAEVDRAEADLSPDNTVQCRQERQREAEGNVEEARSSALL